MKNYVFSIGVGDYQFGMVESAEEIVNKMNQQIECGVFFDSPVSSIYVMNKFILREIEVDDANNESVVENSRVWIVGDKNVPKNMDEMFMCNSHEELLENFRLKLVEILGQEVNDVFENWLALADGYVNKCVDAE